LSDVCQYLLSRRKPHPDPDAEHRVESMIELEAHSIFRSRTQIGDQLTMERYGPKKAAAISVDKIC
jgi:hypothetical protein